MWSYLKSWWVPPPPPAEPIAAKKVLPPLLVVSTIGEDGVGKYSLAYRFEGIPTLDLIHTLCQSDHVDFTLKTIEILDDNHELTPVRIQVKYKSFMRHLRPDIQRRPPYYYGVSDALVMCYDTTRLETLDVLLEKWVPQAVSCKRPGQTNGQIPLTIVGTKTDKSTAEMCRNATKTIELAAKAGKIPFSFNHVQLSLKDSPQEAIDNVFAELAQRIMFMKQ